MSWILSVDPWSLCAAGICSGAVLLSAVVLAYIVRPESDDDDLE